VAFPPFRSRNRVPARLPSSAMNAFGEDEACDCTVEEEVVPRDGCADGSGDDGSAQLRTMLALGQCREGVREAAAGRHVKPPVSGVLHPTVV
jgi:hypothetical protein